jgi:hypothetical protein
MYCTRACAPVGTEWDIAFDRGFDSDAESQSGLNSDDEHGEGRSEGEDVEPTSDDVADVAGASSLASQMSTQGLASAVAVMDIGVGCRPPAAALASGLLTNTAVPNRCQAHIADGSRCQVRSDHTFAEACPLQRGSHFCTAHGV